MTGEIELISISGNLFKKLEFRIPVYPKTGHDNSAFDILLTYCKHIIFLHTRRSVEF